MIAGLSHITLIVRDLERSARFFRAILAAEEIYASGKKRFSRSHEKFLLINGIWLCLMEGEPLLRRAYEHIAFKIAEADFDSYLAKITEAGAEIHPARPRVEGEGRSIYFYDFDDHLFELHTGNLQDRLKAYAQAEGPGEC
jgi:catechol 2,3-dioxygenase-like lactoylglutathione lyase family enzyme